MPGTQTKGVSSPEFHANAHTLVSPRQIPAAGGNFQCSTCRARSDAIEISCLSNAAKWE